MKMNSKTLTPTNMQCDQITAAIYTQRTHEALSALDALQLTEQELRLLALACLDQGGCSLSVTYDVGQAIGAYE